MILQAWLTLPSCLARSSKPTLARMIFWSLVMTVSLRGRGRFRITGSPPHDHLRRRPSDQVKTFTLEILEGRLDLGQLDVELPQVRRVLPTQIGAQQIATLAPARFAELLAIELETERGALRSKRDIDQAPGRRRLGACGAELHEQVLAFEAHRGELLEPGP